ncbi:Dual specificity phosphatase, catalytic domain [Gimesia alba]|uniref:Dual specificity phosphatase, catalytic domain n=1 Tax=Gimesia alba TaxID=2527973 RepID=A0A517RJS8_9PLAN|nr:dual specificity protein phosphatase [Gimesia alba]QDT44140.1 Dual specificity phosphatase, catalytic domain [Gimesia alba]
MREVFSQLLWIGNARDARDVQGVLDLGIAAVIDLALEEPPITFPREIVYCRLPLIDGDENNPAILESAIETTTRFVQSEVPTLVACSGGMSRSPAIAAAAMSRINQTRFADIIKQIAADGPCDVAPGLWNAIQALLEP